MKSEISMLFRRLVAPLRLRRLRSGLNSDRAVLPSLTPPPREAIGGPIVRMVAQRESGDCTVACLAMATGVQYEEALAALQKVGGRRRNKAYRLCYVERAASLRGRPLARRRRGGYDPRSSAGIVCVRGGQRAHVAVLWNGLVFDTDGRIWLLDDYLEFWGHTSRLCTLLQVERIGHRD